jgi:hypothetical protein
VGGNCTLEATKKKKEKKIYPYEIIKLGHLPHMKYNPAPLFLLVLLNQKSIIPPKFEFTSLVKNPKSCGSYIK